MINAGELNQRIDIQRIASIAKNATNQDVPLWETITTIWAAIKTVSGEEKVLAKQVKAMAKYEIKVRPTDLNVMDRLVYRGLILQITHINRDNPDYLIIDASGKV